MPASNPPPVTRSSSDMPVDTRAACMADTSDSRWTLPRCCGSRTDTTASSTMVFHAPQAGHLPIQRGDS